MSPLGHRAVVVCAAAVSDFHVATPPEHKIQSTGGAGLTLELDAVPKMLGLLKPWGARCVVSFKLETDAALVDAKAAAALEHYGVDGVVANLLDSYATRATVHAPAAFDAPLRLEDARGVDGALADAIVRIHGAAGAPPPPDPLAVRLVDEVHVDACIDALLAAARADVDRRFGTPRPNFDMLELGHIGGVLDESIALVEFSERGRRARVETVRRRAR